MKTVIALSAAGAAVGFILGLMGITYQMLLFWLCMALFYALVGVGYALCKLMSPKDIDIGDE
jgi:uncharacterized membrane protein YgaE (UPF0421/DUF939 family)